ncbi:MAG: hemolysin III family protein [Coriobacteriales bacterium]|nr:hemolysin III family protein [Coriobacteriales bacterium]
MTAAATVPTVDSEGALARACGFLGSVPAWYLATSVGNKPHVRPFSFAAVEDDRLWFVTANNKDVYFELVENPWFELSAWAPGNPWLIAAGKAVFAEPSRALREEGFHHMVGLGEAHDSADDGLLVFFYIDEGSVRICDITGSEETFALRAQSAATSASPAPPASPTSPDHPAALAPSGTFSALSARGNKGSASVNNIIDKTAKKLHDINEYTLGEEVANSITHGIGALLSIAALVLLIVFAKQDGGGVRLAAGIIFGVTLILEYTNSTLYHAFPWPRVKKLFKIFDHSSIYLLIAGTYTPFTLVTFADNGGVWMTALIWGLAITGVAVEAFWVFRPRWLTALLYLIMGWLIIIRAPLLLELMALPGVVLLVAGGVCYSLGVIFYVMKKVRYMHSIWHLWVLAGSILHFLCILLYVL